MSATKTRKRNPNDLPAYVNVDVSVEPIDVLGELTDGQLMQYMVERGMRIPDYDGKNGDLLAELSNYLDKCSLPQAMRMNEVIKETMNKQ